MPCKRLPMRYGHSEGQTDVCFDEQGRYILTCGSDGDVRIWEGLDDDDPKSITVGEKAFSLTLKNGKLVTAVSNNTVQVHTFPEGDPDGILTRFTANPSHVSFNASGTRVAAGSSDFVVKVVEVADSSQQKTFRGHEAPVLSVAFDPKEEFLASSSCDGSVNVWNIDEQIQVTNWPVLQKSSDITNAKSLCRLVWQPPSGKLLAVPVETRVHLYERNTWKHIGSLADDFITQAVNVVAWSPCGRFLAAGTIAGYITVWDVESKMCQERQKHEKGFTVCGMAWHPSGNQIVYTDTEGCLGLLDNVSTAEASTAKAPQTKSLKEKETDEYDKLFDTDANGFLNDEASESDSPVKRSGVDENDDDDDDLMPATGRVRHRTFLDDDDNSQDAGSISLDKFGANADDASSAIVPAVPAMVPRPVYDGPMPTPQQRAFQSGSTPAHLMHRFMIWNSVGIVRGYNDEQENGIDVEFHDTAVHHAMHLTNSLNYTLADLSQEAVLLACESTEELASKVLCLHFSSWDNNKEWMVDLPTGEDARALCLGLGWAAVATTGPLVRLFSIGGVQLQMFSLPGPVVCMAGHGEQLLIAYHRGMGFHGDQALGVLLMKYSGRRLIHGDALPLSPKSYLAWLGFTAEGTPCAIDSDGVVRLLNRSLGNTWTPVANTREHCKGKSDHYWVVGLHENPQQLRCIPCKGSRYPPTLPRPAVAILPFNIPLCQTTTEKGKMEEQFWRSSLFQNHYKFLASSGYEIDEEGQSQMKKEQESLLLKMFALSCKLNREFRCVELAEMMSHETVTLAIRYALSSRRTALAQRLSQLALEKANQGTDPQEQEEEEPEYYGSRARGSNRGQPHWRRTREEEEEEVVEEHEEQMETEEEANDRTPSLNILGRRPSSHEEASPKPVSTSSKEARVNPFKVSAPQKASVSPAAGRAANVLDTITMSSRKTAAQGSASSKQIKSPVLKPLVPRPKSKTQATLLQMSSRSGGKKQAEQEKEPDTEKPKQAEDATPPASTGDNQENCRPKTGFQLWLEENRKTILADSPDLEETAIIKEAMGRFRTLSAEERLSWTERAKGEPVDVKKRKREEKEVEDGAGEGGHVDQEQETVNKKKKPLDTSAKLSAFAFNKN